MKRLFIIMLLSFSAAISRAHDGEDHGTGKKAVISGAGYFSSEALSDKYEVLVKYGELDANKESALQLFLSDAYTNRAINSATISIKVLDQPGIKLNLTRVDSGIYTIKGLFPKTGRYDLQISINASKGPDFLQVPAIEVGKKLTVPAEAQKVNWYDNKILWAIVGLVLGISLMYGLMRRRNKKVSTTFFIVFLLIPVAAINPSLAHDGEDHAAAPGKGGGISNAFIVEKESQFLFDIITDKTGSGSFYQSTEMLGKVTASPKGLAVIQAPQPGKIVVLSVTPGQTVSKGQTLAVVEQQVEAGTQIDIVTQRNTLNAEVKAARAQYERLKSIEDIAAKKDVTEAKARYEAAVQNLQVFNASLSGNMGSSKMISLTAPISGVVGTFNYAIGAVVNAGQTLFEITNLNQVFIETQVFVSDLNEINKSNRLIAFSNYDTAAYSLKMVSTAQTVNAENQSQRVIFEVINPNQKFKIGENVRVLKYSDNRIAQLVIPTEAITDVNGKPAVFIKDKAEQFSISFIQKGESNALQTSVIKGVEAGERIVTENIYQMKMIYLNQ